MTYAWWLGFATVIALCVKAWFTRDWWLWLSHVASVRATRLGEREDYTGDDVLWKLRIMTGNAAPDITLPQRPQDKWKWLALRRHA